MNQNDQQLKTWLKWICFVLKGESTVYICPSAEVDSAEF